MKNTKFSQINQLLKKKKLISDHQSSHIEELYFRRLRKMGGEERIKICSELSEMIREVCRAGIKYRNPNLSEEEIEKELWTRIYK